MIAMLQVVTASIYVYATILPPHCLAAFYCMKGVETVFGSHRVIVLKKNTSSTNKRQ